MRRELLRILDKRNWTREDVEELKVLFESGLEGFLDGVEPDILETALRYLARGKGNVLKRLDTASKMTGIPPEYLVEVLHVLHPSRYPFPDGFFIEIVKTRGLNLAIETRKHGDRGESREDADFPDLVQKLERIHPLDLKGSLLEDAEIAWEISKSFKEKLMSSNVHPYILRVLGSRRRIPLVVDGSNLIWKANLDPVVLEDLFIALSDHKTTFYPVFIVFDANVEYVIPRYRRGYIRDLMEKDAVYLHSPADELMISLARQRGAWIMSSDKFRDHDISGIKLVDFPDI